MPVQGVAITRKNVSCLISTDLSFGEGNGTPLSTLAWKIPWKEEPGRLQSMGSRRVGHDSASSLSPFTFMHWRRKWQPTPVFLPGESQGRGSLVGCRLWGHTESDMNEVTQQQQQQQPDSKFREASDNIPGLGRSSGEGKGYLLQYSGLENFVDCIVYGVTKTRT